MKKVVWVPAVFSAVLFSASLCFAFADDDSQPDMTPSSMVGTSEGGALVLYGHTLTRYDSDLEVVKVVDVRKSAKPMQALPTGEDMMIRPHSSRDDSAPGSSDPAPPPGVFRIPTLTKDTAESRPKISEPSSEL